MPGHDIITIGASAGGVETLISLVRGLPFNLPAAVFVVVHFPPHSPSLLPDILNRNGSLPAGHAQHGELIQTGRIYVATPDYHLLVRRGAIHIVRGPRENHCRPAIDPLFRSAALAYGPRVIGVILSGTLGDGTAGLFAVKEQGGIAIVQDPQDALFPEMPHNAMFYVQCDYVVPLADLADLLVRLSHEPVEEISMVSSDMEKESAVAEIDMATIENQEKPESPRLLPAQTVVVLCGSYRMANCCAFAAGPDTRFPPKVFWWSRAKRSKVRYGPRCVDSKKMPP